MALTRKQKETTVANVGQAVSEATSVVFMSFDGLTITDVNELRDKLHEQGSAMQVVPKRLLDLALKSAEVDFDPITHEGQIAVIWGQDPVAPAKVLHDFAKSRENVQLRAGVLEGEVVSSQQVVALAKLPSREQLLGQLLSVMSGPSRGFVTVLSGVPRSFVYALNAIKDQKQA